jgi:hypothetical protein
MVIAYVVVFDKRISEGYARLDIRICKEHMWKLCVLRDGIYFPVLL